MMLRIINLRRMIKETGEMIEEIGTRTEEEMVTGGEMTRGTETDTGMEGIEKETEIETDGTGETIETKRTLMLAARSRVILTSMMNKERRSREALVLRTRR